MDRRIPLAALACLVAVPVAGALLHDGPDVDPGWSARPREVALDWDATRFAWTSTATEGHNDTVQVAFDSRDDVVHVRFTDPVDGSVVGLRVRVDSVVEFLDQDGDGAYGLGDPLVQHVSVGGTSFGRVRVAEAEGGHVATVWYPLPHSSGGMQLRFDLPDQDATPVRFRMHLEDFPFQSDNHTRLAVGLRAFGTPHLFAGGLWDGGGAYRVTWLWNATTDAGAVGTTLQPYSVASQNQTLVVFGHPRSPVLDHDTWFSAQQVLPEDVPIAQRVIGEWRWFALGTAAAVAFLGGTVAYAVRREA